MRLRCRGLRLCVRCMSGARPPGSMGPRCRRVREARRGGPRTGRRGVVLLHRWRSAWRWPRSGGASVGMRVTGRGVGWRVRGSGSRGKRGGRIGCRRASCWALSLAGEVIVRAGSAGGPTRAAISSSDRPTSRSLTTSAVAVGLGLVNTHGVQGYRPCPQIRATLLSTGARAER